MKALAASVTSISLKNIDLTGELIDVSKVEVLTHYIENEIGSDGITTLAPQFALQSRLELLKLSGLII